MGENSDEIAFKFSIVNTENEEDSNSPEVKVNKTVKSMLKGDINNDNRSPLSDPKSGSSLSYATETSGGSLMLPVVILFCVIVVILGLGSLRGLWSIYRKRYVAGEQKSRPSSRSSSRPASRAQSLDSRRSSAYSRASLYSTSSSLRRQYIREKHLEREREQIYQEIKT